ncbi:MAG: TonB-dependent siderophore receptor [Leptolyngbya sp. SIO1E4]|nr:TonB-dependent siderophore receptor [Leptolyngbya sp. SIO1E4]
MVRGVPFGITALLALLSMPSAIAEEAVNRATENQTPAATEPTNGSGLTEPIPVEAVPQPAMEGVATTVDEWLTPIAQAELVEITNIQVEETAEGFTLQLETTGELAVPETAIMGNAAIADIPNAVLQLPDGEEFLVSEPAESISLINITNLPDNQVRIAITGTDAPPAIDISTEATGLTISGIPGDPTVQAPDEEAIQVVVTGEAEDDDYFVPNASTATRTDTPILDTPASIQVIPRQVLEDQQVVRLEEALTNVSGVTPGNTLSGNTETFNIRGFENTRVLQDGFRQFGGFGANITETANLEQVEVLKGPASILYGEIQPGGVINVVTKQPLSEPYYDLQAQVGSREFISPSLDFSGPLTADGRLRYRLNALVRREESFRDFNNNLSRSFIAPTLAWQISDRTDLTVQFEYIDDELLFDNSLVASGEDVVDVPLDRNLFDPANHGKSEFINVGYNLEHRFSDNWRLRNAFRYTYRDNFVFGALQAGFDENTGILTRVPGSQNLIAENYSLQTNIVGEFATGSIQHTLLFGIDLNRTDISTFARIDFSNRQPLNIFDPVYGVFADINFDDLPIFRDIDGQSDRLGIYLQDQINFSDNLILLAGLRYDTVEQSTVNGPTAINPTPSGTTQNDDAVTPRVGIVYQPTSNISLYGSYSQSFTPSSVTTAAGDPLEPERGEGFEVGVKTELLDGDLLATLAYFNITKQNVATQDPNNSFFSVATGEQHSQGIELDIAGEILPGWNVIASYAYIDAEVTEDNVIPEGNRLFNSPRHSASLWTNYEIQAGDLAGLGFGLGFNFVGERAGDLANSFEIDSYVLANAAISYERDDWRLALNIKNLFDTDYIRSTSGSRLFGNLPGEPFTVIGSFSIQF